MSDWRPRLIASDMDGTLLRWDDTVSDATVAELERWRADGVPVVLATGRPPRWMVRIREVLGRVADGDLSVRAGETGGAELGEVARYPGRLAFPRTYPSGGS